MQAEANIVLIQPFGYTHSLALQELGEYLQLKVADIIPNCRLVKNRLVEGKINIVLGAHLIESADQLPRQCIIVNTEQIGAEASISVGDKYMEILNKNYVWDYSAENAARIPHENTSIFSLWNEERLKRLTLLKHKEYDLLFYGSLNTRRIKILEELRSRGLVVQSLFNIYAEERDYFIERTKAVLNLHYYSDSTVLEQVRLFWPLINGVPVISEEYMLTSAPVNYGECIYTPQGVDFIDYTQDWIEKYEENISEFPRRLQKFKSYGQAREIENALKGALAYFEKNTSMSCKEELPTKINLGSGKDYRKGYLNIDTNAKCYPDLVADLGDRYSLPLELNDSYGNSIILKESYFEEIIALDVLEHVENLAVLMKNCLSLLCTSGKMYITVPYDLSLGAWQDPTHLRAFNQNSWKYYTDWFWYMGWFEYRFELEQLTYKPTDLGSELLGKNYDEERILSTPRAIDSMSVILKKVKTSIDERTMARTMANCIIGKE